MLNSSSMVSPYAKIISFLFFFVSVLICPNYYSLSLMFLIFVFVSWRNRVNYDEYLVSYFILFTFLLIISFISGIGVIYAFKMMLIVLYLRFLFLVNNYIELNKASKKIFDYPFTKLVYNIYLFEENYRDFSKFNYGMYGKKMRINSLYLTIVNHDKRKEKIYIKMDDMGYKAKETKRCLYGKLFVFMHIICFVFVILSGVYR